MPKELIVSVNGREKKIAIIENGKVTEFYIERGEGGQGIVGNIYKGRVMRVLPGMQSAFVDIGLERDAFLYVSDFFDEEEEFERIVVDKTKTEGADAARALAAEKIERARIERERQIETAHERVEPIGDTDEEADEDAEPETAAPAPVELVAAPAEATQAPATTTDDTDATGGRRGRRRRGRGGRSEETDAPRAVGSDTPATHAGSQQRNAGAREPVRVAADDTPFAAAAGSFERIVDEDEAAFGEGEMFKDARLQERITDQIRGIEFDLGEAAQDVEVGSVLAANKLSGGTFERIADEEFDYAATPREVNRAQPAVAASVAALTESVSDKAPAAARSFERVSDDVQASEAEPQAATKGKPARARRSKKGAADVETPAEEVAAIETASEEAAPQRKRAAKGATKGAAKKAATKSATKGSAKGRAKRGKTATGEAEGEPLADAEASMKAAPARGEFARRGGRRRNRRPKPGENGEAEDNSNGTPRARRAGG